VNRVLIVDDEKDVRAAAAAMVNHLGFIPTTAADAEEALKIFHEVHPGIVLTDIRLGQRSMDGVALCSKLRFEDQSLSVIAMSGYFNEYDKIYTIAAGFSDFLTKPIKLKELGSALKCAFERRSRWVSLP